MERSFGSRYVLGDVIGRGAMGRVYRARMRDGSPDVAVKLLREDLATQPEVVTLFVRERDLLRAVAHPNVVKVHDLVIEGDELGIVMELVSAGHLRKALPPPTPPSQAVELIAQAADGLAAVHAAGVVHRDLKPENMLVETLPDGGHRLRLTDFGISRITGNTATTLTTVIGTPGYIAPEVARGRRAGTAADVYALGVILFEWCTGRPLFQADNAIALLRAHSDDVPPRLVGAPAELDALLDDCLAKDPADRPSASELATRLRALKAPLAGALPFAVESADAVAASAPTVERAVPERIAALLGAGAGAGASARAGSGASVGSGAAAASASSDALTITPSPQLGHSTPAAYAAPADPVRQATPGAGYGPPPQSQWTSDGTMEGHRQFGPGAGGAFPGAAPGRLIGQQVPAQLAPSQPPRRRRPLMAGIAGAALAAVALGALAVPSVRDQLFGTGTAKASAAGDPSTASSTGPTGAGGPSGAGSAPVPLASTSGPSAGASGSGGAGSTSQGSTSQGQGTTTTQNAGTTQGTKTQVTAKAPSSPKVVVQGSPKVVPSSPKVVVSVPPSSPAVQLPGALGSISLSGATQTTLVLSWGVSANATSYLMGWTESGTGLTWTGEYPHSASPLTLINLKPGHTYDVWVQGHSSAGDGPRASRSAATNSAPVVLLPGALASMSLSGATQTTMVLSWGVSTNATSYLMGWTESGTGLTWTGEYPHSASPLTLINLKPGHSYTVWVRGHNADGNGPTSTQTLSALP